MECSDEYVANSLANQYVEKYINGKKIFGKWHFYFLGAAYVGHTYVMERESVIHIVSNFTSNFITV